MLGKSTHTYAKSSLSSELMRYGDLSIGRNLASRDKLLGNNIKLSFKKYDKI